jgi:hypothetical protein
MKIKINVNQKYIYVPVNSKSQKSNWFIESQKQQLIQNGILKKKFESKLGPL